MSLRKVKIIVVTRDIGCGCVSAEVMRPRGEKYPRVYSTERAGDNARERAKNAAIAGYAGTIKPCEFIVESVHFTGSPLAGPAKAEFEAWLKTRA